jgi:DNA-binding winged helix-turn-helix (wHTH) protein/TolB-like protein
MSQNGKLRVGEWCVDPAAGRMTRGSEVMRVEARTMRLLLDLAQHAGQVVSIDDLLERVWSGVTVTPDSVYQAVAALRRLLEDDPKQPTYIATVPRLGYRMIASVAPWEDALPHRSMRKVSVAVFGAVSLVCVFAVINQVSRAHGTPASVPVTVGVMPFLDFTDTMDQEPLVDAVTEAVVDRLSANPALRTASFRSSFLLKGKHASVGQAGKALGVAHLIEGTVRKTGERVTITARLVRADTGFVEWTKSYEQPLSTIARAEGDIAANAGRVLGTR